MKNMIKELIPPIILRISDKLIDRNRQKSYKTHQEALEDCQNDNYESSDLVKVVVEKSALFAKSIDQDPTLDIGALRTLIAVGFAKQGNLLRVLDFGGAGGYHYTIARKMLTDDVNLKWNVVETSAMSREAQKLASSELSFFDNINDAKEDLGQVDLLFTSGALHACSDPYSILQELLSVNAKYFVITRTSFNDTNEQLISIQKSYLSTNGPGDLPVGIMDRAVYYPNVFISRQSAEIALSNRYEIRFKTIEDQAAYRVGKKKIGMYGYFCIRKNES